MRPPARDFPFPLPNGWFRVAFVEDLERGREIPLRYFGRDLVLACAGSGEAQVLERGGARAWPTRVSSRIVWAWHHPDGRAPCWAPPEVSEVEDPGWSPLIHHRWRVRTRNQEIAENTSDPAHFAAVHGFAGVPSPEIRFDEHRCRSFSAYRAPNRQGELVESTLEVVWHGLGIGVTRSTGTVELLFIGTITPVDEELVEACFSFSVCRERGLDPDRGPGRASIVEAIRQMEQDIPIWENKRYRDRPLLCEQDGPIGPFRSWARQFYA